MICGSVGATNSHSAGAQYVMLEKLGEEWRIEHQDVPYDIEQTLKRFQEAKYIEKAGPMGRLLVRGIATRTNQMIPFLRWYRSHDQDLGLAEAIDVFLNLY